MSIFWHTTTFCNICKTECRFCYEGDILPNHDAKIYYSCKNEVGFIMGISGWSSRDFKEDKSISCSLIKPKPKS